MNMSIIHRRSMMTIVTALEVWANVLTDYGRVAGHKLFRIAFIMICKVLYENEHCHLDV